MDERIVDFIIENEPVWAYEEFRNYLLGKYGNQKVKENHERIVRKFNQIKWGNYQTYLNSRTWKDKKDLKYKTSPYRCVKCGINKGLEVHHTVYGPWGLEDINDLVYYCRQHHDEYHSTIIKDWSNN
jgi:hypothetical protein